MTDARKLYRYIFCYVLKNYINKQKLKEEIKHKYLKYSTDLQSSFKIDKKIGLNYSTTKNTV